MPDEFNERTALLMANAQLNTRLSTLWDALQWIDGIEPHTVAAAEKKYDIDLRARKFLRE